MPQVRTQMVYPHGKPCAVPQMPVTALESGKKTKVSVKELKRYVWAINYLTPITIVNRFDLYVTFLCEQLGSYNFDYFMLCNWSIHWRMCGVELTDVFPSPIILDKDSTWCIIGIRCNLYIANYLIMKIQTYLRGCPSQQWKGW